MTDELKLILERFDQLHEELINDLAGMYKENMTKLDEISAKIDKCAKKM